MSTHADVPEAPRNAATAMARTVLEALVAGGVRDLVLAPGSRSAPLAFAAHAAAGRLRLHTRVDERTAGFLALGLAKASRVPVAVVTTSGTAVANLHPAVLEADAAGVPLLLLTADRPADLRGTQANQTTDQVGIFGTAARWDLDVPPGIPGVHEQTQVEDWRDLVARAVRVAGGADGPPGPVQLNLQLADPLVPGAEGGWSSPVDASTPLAADVGRTRPAGVEVLRAGPRTVVIAGDDAGPPARNLAEQGGWPLLAEPSSGARTGTHAIRSYRLLLGASDLTDRIERVVVCGHPTLSRPVVRLISRDDVEVVAVRNATGHTDPGHRVSRVHDVLTGEPGSDPAWLEEWRRRDAEVSAAVDQLVADRAAEEGGVLPQQVAAAVSAAVPPGGLLFVGASNPVRDLDLMARPATVGERRLVLANRGLAGIDGTLSSAIGAALGRERTSRAFALVGDVTFLHDATALVLGPDEPRPDLTIVVVNDDGGSVFASLEQGGPEYAGSFERLFGTPHGVDLAAVCAATRTPHWRVESVAELEHALASAAGGIEVVEVRCRRDGRRALDEALRSLA
ncbi:MAG: 2-succinyl-5-enolpyruvyl-6-hydroxy-3-cyclohexene-1-carboxylic-acid synthase [Nocardioides sp.]|nr:2-succinyl-5-enolpyruvyl-6-hydroxy-3-cyclohexene-1-carboxylic-acid synthase [Nocardioides sp.]